MSIETNDATARLNRIINRNGRHIAALDLASEARRTCCEALRNILSDIEQHGCPTVIAVGVARRFLDEADALSAIATEIGREVIE